MIDNRTNVMIVDDAPSNLQLLVSLMQMEGYKVRPVRSGAAALDLVREIRPDLILLDINMPEMDGFEVCRRLKADPRHSDIPVVFISALHDTRDKVKAFEVGGTDYITKPFQMEEVRMRIETHLHLAQMKIELENANRKLRESERLQELLARLVAHDMRAPLTGILGMADLVALAPPVRQAPELMEHVVCIQDSARNLERMISDMLDVYKQECGKLVARTATVPFGEMAEEAVRMLAVGGSRHPFEARLPDPATAVRCDRRLTVRVLANLLGNAFRYTREGTPVTLTAAPEPGFLRVCVTDEGEGIAPEDQPRLFQKFGQLEVREKGLHYSSGLGLVFCRMVVEEQGGRIGVDSVPGRGSTFWFTLPLA